jgi:DNA-binding SARP family transcriptional activator
MKRLQVLLLGPPEIRWDDQLLRIRRRYTRAMLFYLASHGGMVGRQELLTTFWYDQPDATARLRLRETLGKLKAALPDPSVLVAEHDLVGFELSSVYVDLLEFQQLIRQIQPGSLHARTSRLESAQSIASDEYQKLNKAVSLWRGKNFLSGVGLPSTPALDEWLIYTAHQIEHDRSWAFEKLSELANATGDLEQSLRFARAALENDELNDELHEKVLRLLIQMRRFNEAREYYDYYSELVTRELRTSPSPRMIALEQTIYLEGRHVHTLNPQPMRVWRVRSSLESPLVGRHVQLDQLNRTYQKGGGIFIFGESGLGKTRLVKEFLENLAPQPRVILSRSLPNENNLPLQPIIDLSRDQITLEEWLQFPKEWVSHVLPIVPDLKAVFPHVKPALPVVPDQARGLLLEAIRQMALILARERRLVVFLDDAQWADEATLATLSYLLERPPFNQDAILILAARDDQPNPDLENLLHHFEASPNVRKIHLTRLNPKDISDITHHVLGKRPTPQVAQLLTNATGGNPLFLLESLRALKDRLPDQELSELANLPLAENLVALIRSRLHMLAPAVRNMLDIAAIIGVEFSPVLLEHVTHSTPEEVITIIDELTNRQLIEFVSQDKNEVCCRFIHDKFREVLLMEMNPLRAKKLHREVADTLEALPGFKSFDQAAILAQHYEIAGEWRKAFEYWLNASDYARHLASYTDASRSFSRAQAILESPGAQIEVEGIAQLFIEWSEMTNEIDDVQALKQMGEKLLQVARQRQDNSLTGISYTITCDALMDENRYSEALAYADWAIPILEQADILSRLSHAHVQRGTCLYMLNRMVDSENAFLRVLRLNPGSQDTRIIHSRANTHYHLANIYNLTAWPVKARQNAFKALTSFIKINRFYGQAVVYSALSMSHHLTGEYNQAIQAGQRGLELVQMIKADRIQGVIRALLAMTEMSLGHIGPALDHANSTVELGERVGHPEIITIGYRMLGDLYWILASHQTALDYYERGLAKMDQSFWGADTLMRLGYAYCHLGQIEKGLDYLRSSEKICSEAGLVMMNIIGKISLATVSTILGEWGQAADIARQVAQISQKRSMRVWKMAASSILGAAAFQAGDWDESEIIFKRLLAQVSKVPNPWIEIRAYAYLERVYQKKGLPSEGPRRCIRELFSRIEKTMGSSCDQSIRQSFRAFQNSDLCAF